VISVYCEYSFPRYSFHDSESCAIYVEIARFRLYIRRERLTLCSVSFLESLYCILLTLDIINRYVYIYIKEQSIISILKCMPWREKMRYWKNDKYIEPKDIIFSTLYKRHIMCKYSKLIYSMMNMYIKRPWFCSSLNTVGYRKGVSYK